jgi:hypothetical protein
MRVRHTFLICVFLIIIVGVLIYSIIHPRENFVNSSKKEGTYDFTCNSSNSAVTLYTGENFSGIATRVPGPKRWNAFNAHKSSDRKLSELGYLDNSVRSIKIKKGYKVTLFQHDIDGIESNNPSPSKLTLTSDASSLKKYNNVDGVSSLVIECDGTQAKPVVNDDGNYRSLQNDKNNDQYCLEGGKLNPRNSMNAKQKLRNVARNGYDGEKGIDAVKLYLSNQFDKSTSHLNINKNKSRMRAWKNCFGINILDSKELSGDLIGNISNSSETPAYEKEPLPPPPPVIPPPPPPVIPQSPRVCLRKYERTVGSGKKAVKEVYFRPSTNCVSGMGSSVWYR